MLWLIATGPNARVGVSHITLVDGSLSALLVAVITIAVVIVLVVVVVSCTTQTTAIGVPCILGVPCLPLKNSSGLASRVWLLSICLIFWFTMNPLHMYSWAHLTPFLHNATLFLSGCNIQFFAFIIDWLYNLWNSSTCLTHRMLHHILWDIVGTEMKQLTPIHPAQLICYVNLPANTCLDTLHAKDTATGHWYAWDTLYCYDIAEVYLFWTIRAIKIISMPTKWLCIVWQLKERPCYCLHCIPEDNPLTVVMSFASC